MKDLITRETKSVEEVADAGESPATFAHLSRRSKTRVERRAAKGGKAGCQGRFHNEQLEFLEGHADRYRTLAQMTMGKNSAMGKFWDEVQGGFWKTFTREDVQNGIKGGENLSREEVIMSTNAVSILEEVTSL
jgi:hypothetical protein